MFSYEKKLQYPINIKNTNPRLAKIIITQYGGPDGKSEGKVRVCQKKIRRAKNVLTGWGDGCMISSRGGLANELVRISVPCGMRKDRRLRIHYKLKRGR